MFSSKLKPVVSGVVQLNRTTKLGNLSGLRTRNVARHFSVSHVRRDQSGQDSEKTTPNAYKYETLLVSNPASGVLQVDLNRPDRLNAFNRDSWREIGECFNAITIDPACRVVILGGQGKHFCAGIDLMAIQGEMMKLMGLEEDAARKGFRTRHILRHYQESLSAIEKCPKPVIAAIHGHCIGAGVDMIAACDIRYCTNETFFSIKEVDIGMAADVGTLQRLPKAVGNNSLARELTFTGRKFLPEEAARLGLISQAFDTRPTMMAAALALAQLIASKSPVAVQGSKINLNYSRDHSVQDGLEHMITWQMAMLQTEDMMKAAMAGADRSGQTVATYADVA